MRLIGSFQTMTIQGRSCSTSSASRGCSTSTSAGASVVDTPPLSPTAGARSAPDHHLSNVCQPKRSDQRKTRPAVHELAAQTSPISRGSRGSIRGRGGGAPGGGEGARGGGGV